MGAADEHSAEWNPIPVFSTLSTTLEASGDKKRGKAI